MFVHPESRGKKYCCKMEELESYERIIVYYLYFRNGKRYPEAIGLYKKMDTILQLIMVNI
jgi:hypothetical protein